MSVVNFIHSSPTTPSLTLPLPTIKRLYSTQYLASLWSKMKTVVVRTFNPFKTKPLNDNNLQNNNADSIAFQKKIV